MNRNMNDRPRPPVWKDDRYDNNNAGGYRGPPPNMDNRDLPKDQPQRDFGPGHGPNRLPPERDLRPPLGGNNSRPAPEPNKWNEPVKPAAPLGPPVQPSGTVSNAARTNDVEIIVTHKSLTVYAEFIERRLKTLGLSVDLLFPNEEVPLGRVLANIASRGTLYALIVTQLNEQRRSITVNVLYGQTQEHRNMPLEEAIALIVKLFDCYMKGEKCPVLPPVGATSITAGGVPLGDRHPEVIQNLLGILIENRSLSAMQYEKLIGYLQEKKDQVRAEPVPQNKTAELQNRILSLLGGDKSLPPTQQSNPTVMKDSPAMKAIQSIMQREMGHSHVGNYGAPRGPRI